MNKIARMLPLAVLKIFSPVVLFIFGHAQVVSASESVQLASPLNAKAGDDSICGVFGGNTYRFPGYPFGEIAEYVGDRPWGGEFVDRENRCSQNLRDVLVRMCESNYQFTNYMFGESQDCTIASRISRVTNDKYMEERVAPRKKDKAVFDRKEGYVGADQLFYKDTRGSIVRRIFWTEGNQGEITALGNCRVQVPIPYCRFETYAPELGASVEVTFPMKKINEWQSYLSAAREQFACFKIEISDRGSRNGKEGANDGSKKSCIEAAASRISSRSLRRGISGIEKLDTRSTVQDRAGDLLVDSMFDALEQNIKEGGVDVTVNQAVEFNYRTYAELDAIDQRRIPNFLMKIALQFGRRVE